MLGARLVAISSQLPAWLVDITPDWMARTDAEPIISAIRETAAPTAA